LQGIEIKQPTAQGIYIQKDCLDTNDVRVTKVKNYLLPVGLTKIFGIFAGMKRACLVILFMCLLPVMSLQATDTYRFRMMSPAGGFYYGGVQSVLQDNDGFIWILIADDLYRFDGYQYKQYHTRFTALDPTKDWQFFDMALDAKGQFFVRTKNGVYSYNKISDTFYACEQAMPQKPAGLGTKWVNKNKDWLPQECTNKTLRAFYVDKNEQVWLGYRDGLYIVNPKTKHCTHYTHDPANPYSLPNNSVWTINGDLQNNVWIGMYAGKLAYVNLDEKFPFDTYFPRDKKLNLSPVSAFAEDETSLWIGTEGGGVNRMNKQTGQFTYYNPAHNHIKSMVIDKKQNVWIGMFTGGLECYNRLTKQSQHFFYKEQDDNSLLLNDIRKIVLDGDSGLWIAYQITKMKISYFSFHTQKFTHYDFTNQETGYYVFDMIKGNENQLWILTGKTLYQMDVRTHQLSAIPQKDASANPVFMNFSTLCLDDAGNLWIGTIGNGLVKYHPKTGEFTINKEILRYKLSSIYSICYSHGNLWMGTDNGLLCYRIAENTFLRYDEKDGIQGNVFYPLASLQGLDGRLYFGGTNGFTIVDPLAITYNSHHPKAVISEFLIDNQPIQLGGEIGKCKIVLNYKQTNFGFQFASDNYVIPEKTLYKYRLKGYDERWIEVDANNRLALYSKVPSGNYTFEVVAANNDGLWNDTPTAIKIRVKPAPWLSWYAYIFYGLMLLGILYLVLQLYLNKVEKNKNDELHKIQMGFYKNYFVNIADLSSNERDKEFLENFVKIIEENLNLPKLDVNFIAAELSMSRSKLYKNIKSMTGKSIVEFILHQRLRKAAQLIVETDLNMRQIMEEIGLESQPYFTNSFKKEFGETPSAFAAKHKIPN
jgi:ligand-binding sensor domain-containing protein/AraC-like DNA-binding protein